jgi:hypothetical protein
VRVFAYLYFAVVGVLFGLWYLPWGATMGCYLLGQFFPLGFSPSRADSVRTLVFASDLVLRVVVELWFTSLYTKRDARLGPKLYFFEEV